MNEAIHNANTYIDNKFVFYRYSFDLNIYSSINNAYNVIISKTRNDELTDIVIL